MKLQIVAGVLCLLSLQSRFLLAQDLTITNARIVAANGEVIERGSIGIRGGRIVSVDPGDAIAATDMTIDANGMTAMPGFIDAHRHINTGPDEREEMQALLEAGYTTVLSGGGPAEGNIALRDHIEQGLINGPRIIPSGRVSLTLAPEEARAEICRLAEMGIKFTGEIGLTSFPGPSGREMEVLRAILDEAGQVGIMVQVHAVSAQSTMAAVEADPAPGAYDEQKFPDPRECRRDGSIRSQGVSHHRLSYDSLLSVRATGRGSEPRKVGF